LATPYFDWYLGLTLGFIVVVAVVVIVAAILTFASRIGEQARTAIEALEQVRDSTAPLWEVRKTNASAVAILGAARAARGALAGPPPAEAATNSTSHATNSTPPAAAPAPEPAGAVAERDGHRSLPERKFNFIVRER
jgi:Sec-independent protein translocase protein TatA